MVNAKVTDLQVLPSYGKGHVMLRWRVEGAEASQCAVNVYRAYDGEPWQRISAPLIVPFFVDETKPITKVDKLLYRLAIEHLPSGRMADAGITGVYEHLLHAHHQIGKRQICQEIYALRKTGGLPCWMLPGPGDRTPAELVDLCKQAHEGGPQMVGADVAQKWQTWIRLESSARKEVRREDGTSKDVTFEQTARLPAFPIPRLGTLIVMPGSDDRYVVGEQIKTYSYHAVIPIVHDVTLQLLARTDPRYNIEMPDIIRSLALPLKLPSA